MYMHMKDIYCPQKDSKRGYICQQIERQIKRQTYIKIDASRKLFERQMEWTTTRQLDRQIDRQINGQIKKWTTIRQIDRQIGQIDRQVDRQIDLRQIDREIERQRDGQKYRQTYRQMDHHQAVQVFCFENQWPQSIHSDLSKSIYLCRAI